MIDGVHAAPGPQVCFTDAGRGDAADRVGRLKDRGVVAVFDSNVAGCVQYYSAHGVDIEPGAEHWHGATAERFMAHVAMQEADDQGQVVTWLDHVSDEEYSRSS